MGFWARIVIYTTRLPPSVPSVANSENEDSNIYIECTKVLLDIKVVGGLDSAAASYRTESLHSIPASSSNHPAQPSHLINNTYTILYASLTQHTFLQGYEYGAYRIHRLISTCPLLEQ